jgi:hypothetical protein
MWPAVCLMQPAYMLKPVKSSGHKSEWKFEGTFMIGESRITALTDKVFSRLQVTNTMVALTKWPVKQLDFSRP